MDRYGGCSDGSKPLRTRKESENYTTTMANQQLVKQACGEKEQKMSPTKNTYQNV